VRIARIDTAEGERLGVVSGEIVQPLAAGVDLLELLGCESAERDTRVASAHAGRALPLAGVRLRPPLQPTTMRDFITFEEHLEGGRRFSGARVPPEWYERPQFYFTNPNSVVGPDDPVAIPPGSALLDLELEVAAIVGRAGSDLTPERARDHIAGYTVFNDWSARDLQAGEMPVGLGPAKAKDFASTLGPWIVTSDELEPYRHDDRLQLDLSAAINAEEIGGDTLANMGWSFEEMLAYASRGARVLPGDVLGSGTCGAGCLLELWGRNGALEPPPLAAGDIVTLTVEGIGSVSNPIVAGVAPVDIPRARAPRRRPRPWDA
jgi:2-keto-4-pentenoate hydratase/2-oxohepta-3-ene-1,7-dioic acid hydratase in catechol pathway